MGRLDLKNVHEKSGRLYYRRKVKGKDHYVRLPDASSPDFARAYAEAAHTAERRAPGRGTMAALVAAYRSSSDFRLIPSAVTRANYSRYLDMIVAEHGHRMVRDVRPFHVRKIRDAMQDKPGKANNWLVVFKALMTFAAVNDWRPDNPGAGIKALKLGEHEPWPAEVLEKALRSASPMVRLAIVTGLFSGARVGDVVRMAHNWHDGRMMEFTASKNKADVAVPMHAAWLDEIAKVPRRHVTILYNRFGKPFTTKAVQEAIRDLMRSIGEEGFTFHGLRKNACCYLAEVGLNDSEIGAIVGMTPQTVRHYTKRRRAYMVALGAAERIARGDVLSITGGRQERRK